MKKEDKANKEKVSDKFSGKKSAEDGKKMIETEKITQGRKDDKEEEKKEEKDASKWRNEG